VPLHALGLDSRAVQAFVAELSRRCGRALDPALPFAHPTLERLAAHLCGEPSARASQRPQPRDEPVALVGIGCRFPGGADNPEALWALLARGGDAVGARPAGHRGASAAGGTTQALERGGFLGDVAGFDAAFFGISPREAVEMDPQQRLMLELSWEALEDAGVLPGTLAGSRSGVFFGCMWRDYAHHAAPVPEAIAQHTATGLDTSIIAARVSYRFGLRGPSLTLNTACSSSLVAVHLACQSLRQGESTLALAGGVNLILAPHSSVAMERFGGLSPDARCKFFDSTADGYVRGEGGGVVVLKLLRDALRDGDPIYCVIRGSSVNNDGASNGLAAPSPIAQAELLRDAYARAGVDPRRVHYVEAHGTGTRLGDAIEAEALGRVLGQERGERPALRVGSVKTNLGHLEAAAGVAGLIKLALAVERRWLPRSLHVRVENPSLRLAERGLEVQREAGPWPAHDEAPLAGVSAFGFGGTNAHVVIEGLAASAEQLLVVAADQPDALARRAQALCAASAAIASSAELASLCEASALHWSTGALRRARVVARPADVQHVLEAPTDARPGRRPRLLFVFSGVGSQWLGMGRSLLLHEPSFRAALEACDAAIAPLAGFSVIHALSAGDARDCERCERYEPLIFSIQVALAALLRAWGVRPDAVVGHSIGELAAAHSAGILELPAAAALICAQAKLFARLEGQGAMALLALGEAGATRLLGELGARADADGAALDAGELALAAINGPRSCVVSGPNEELAALLELARARGVFAARVRTEVAFHSPAAGKLARRLAALGELAPRSAHTPMLSSVRGAWLRGPECDAGYWMENQRAPVRFDRALDVLHARAATQTEAPWAALELSPHALLGRELREALGAEALVLPTLLRDAPERATLLASAAALYEAGIELDLRAVAGAARPAARLPEAARQHLPLGSCAQAEAAGSAAPLVLPLSAHTPEALREQAERFREHLRARSDLRFEDVVHKAATARTHFGHRLALSGSSRRELCDGLAAFARGDHAPGLVQGENQAAAGARGCVFVFSGHGSHWPGMCSELLAYEPVFRDVIERCDALFERHGVHALRAQLELDQNPAPPANQVQPRLFAVQLGLAALWRSWGVEPAAVIGHSVGEIAAAHVAGCLDLEDAARAVCERASVLTSAIGRGGMLLVELPRDAARAVVERYPGRLALAVHHSPRFSVLSGELDALSAVLDELLTREIFCRRVAVDYASHGPQMAELAESLEQRLHGLTARAPRIPMMSTSRGGWLREAACGADYWARNLREPVLFDETVGQLLEAGFDSFLELSPHPLLTGALQEIGAASALPSLRRGAPQRAALKESLAALFVRGHAIDWAKQFVAPARRVPLPTYPFERVQHWKSVAGLSLVEPNTGVLLKLPSEPAPAPARAERTLRARLAGASAEQRRALVRGMLLRELARVLRAEPSQLDPEAQFSSLGLDSLLGLELRNRVEAETGIAVPGNLLWSRPSVSGLEHYVIDKLSPALKAG
jgi:acyl transferase domain-containing protein